MGDWMALPDPVQPSTSYDTPTGAAAPYWDSTTQTCYGVLGGSVRLEFEWAYQGEFSSPQPKIVAARQVWERSTWRFFCDGTSTDPPCAGTSQGFPVWLRSASWFSLPACTGLLL